MSKLDGVPQSADSKEPNPNPNLKTENSHYEKERSLRNNLKDLPLTEDETAKIKKTKKGKKAKAKQTDPKDESTLKLIKSEPDIGSTDNYDTINSKTAIEKAEIPQAWSSGMKNYTNLYLPSGKQVQTPSYDTSLKSLEHNNPSKGRWKREALSYKPELETDKYHIIREKNNIDLIIVPNYTSPR